ncbi:hypothetical protein [Streptomyces blattellae]|uniref:hypothetical protein n=1 Tax=Streptomyces blattellae TaxID=2569855 RepID=UPI0018ACD95A|nr:hypothetical protein [Streptomyces blattellae]
MSGAAGALTDPKVANASSDVLAVRSQYWLAAVCQQRGQTGPDPAVGTDSRRTAVQEFAGSDVAWVNNLYLRGEPGDRLAPRSAKSSPRQPQMRVRARP